MVDVILENVRYVVDGSIGFYDRMIVYTCDITKNRCYKPDCRYCRVPERYDIKLEH